MKSPIDEEDREFVVKAGTFRVELMPVKPGWHYREKAKLPAHDAVLRPLLRVASECWAYGIQPASEVYEAAVGVLTPEKRRFRVNLEGDPVKNHELFWNARAGKRGTIVIVIPRTDFDGKRIFRAGYGASLSLNVSAGHTPAALRFARRCVESSDVIAACLPRNNGIQWMDVFVNRKRVLALFQSAVDACGCR